MRIWSPALGAVGTLAVAGILASSTTAAPAARASFSAHDAAAKALLGTMTLDEKIGQMTQPEQDRLKDSKDVETYFLGSVLSGGDSDPKTNSLQDWTDMYDRLQAQALEDAAARSRSSTAWTPSTATTTCSARSSSRTTSGSGRRATPKLVEEIARITAAEVRATGIQWTFAPCVAVVRDERWGRTYESFSEDPPLVAELGAAAVRGLQGAGLDGSAARARLRQALRRRRRHGLGHGHAPRGRARGRFPLDQGDTR